MKVLEKVIRPEKLEQMKKSMKKPKQIAEVVKLADRKSVDWVLQSGVEATEETTRTGSINEQVDNIAQLTKGKEDKSKGMVI